MWDGILILSWDKKEMSLWQWVGKACGPVKSQYIVAAGINAVSGKNMELWFSHLKSEVSAKLHLLGMSTEKKSTT